MEHIKQLRAKGIPTLLTAAVLIFIVLGLDQYMDSQKNEENAQKLMQRELKIAEMGIAWETYDVEVLIEKLSVEARQQLEHPDSLQISIRRTLEQSDFIRCVAIGFIPNFYEKKGYWYEPRCIRIGQELVSEQIGGPGHDYFKMEWYLQGVEAHSTDVGDNNLKWTSPYVEHLQNDDIIMSLTKPLITKDGMVAGVLCVDVLLTKLKQLLRSVEPYPNSICQLLDDKGKLLVSSANADFDDDDYFIDEKILPKHHLKLRLACPKSEVYGSDTTEHVLTWTLSLMGLLLIAFIVQRSFHNIIKLNIAHQQQQTVESELRIAHDIQMNMLRSDFPPELSAIMKPMKEVGGDLYDFYQKDDNLFFIIGDVSGKGLPAAMTMAGTVVLFRMAARHYDTPVEIVTEMNRVVSERNAELSFVTTFVGKLDLRHGLLTYCNAGHNPPVLNGRLLSTDPDIPIGYDANYNYRLFGALFPKGSQIVLYTDGITEAPGTNRKLMGKKQFLSIVTKHQKENVSDLTRHIMQDTYAYCGHAEPSDDMTLMCISNATPEVMPSLIISNKTEELPKVKSLLREYGTCLNCTPREMRKIQLAVEEALVNVVNYAYPQGEQGNIEIDIVATMTANGQQGSIVIRIADRGVAFDPLSHGSADIEQMTSKRQVGGLGIYLYQKMMDKVSYKRTPDGRNVLTLTKLLNEHTQPL